MNTEEQLSKTIFNFNLYSFPDQVWNKVNSQVWTKVSLQTWNKVSLVVRREVGEIIQRENLNGEH